MKAVFCRIIVPGTEYVEFVVYLWVLPKGLCSLSSRAAFLLLFLLLILLLWHYNPRWTLTSSKIVLSIPFPILEASQINVYFMRWDSQPHAHSPTWKTIVSLCIQSSTLKTFWHVRPFQPLRYRQQSSQTFIPVSKKLLPSNEKTKFLFALPQ